MSEGEPTRLVERTRASLTRDLREEITDFAAILAQHHDALAVLFYGSNLRSGELDGVLDFYVLTPGPRERGLWPRVAYHEMKAGADVLRAKVAIMNLATFDHAARGRHVDTTIWARFVQPSAIAWARDDGARAKVASAVAKAARTAARFAAVLGPEWGTERAFWQGLFAATYRAELRVEAPGRESQILDNGAAHFDGLLAPAWKAGGIPFIREGDLFAVRMDPRQKAGLQSRWARRRRLGKPLNVVRLLRAGLTFEGGARYLAWKIERHSDVKVRLTPFREKHPLLCAPVLVGSWLRAKRRAGRTD